MAAVPVTAGTPCGGGSPAAKATPKLTHRNTTAAPAVMPGPSGTRFFADAPAAPPLNPNPIGERERRSEQHRPCQTDGAEQEAEGAQHHRVARIERPAPATQLGDDDRQRDGGDTERHADPGRPRAIAARAQITPYGRGGEQRQHQARIDDRPARVQDGHSRHRGQHQARAKAANHQIGHCDSSFVGPFPDSFGGVFSAAGAGTRRRTWRWTGRSIRRQPAGHAEGCRQQRAPGAERHLPAEARQQNSRRPAGLDPLAVPLKQFLVARPAGRSTSRSRRAAVPSRRRRVPGPRP